MVKSYEERERSFQTTSLNKQKNTEHRIADSNLILSLMLPFLTASPVTYGARFSKPILSVVNAFNIHTITVTSLYTVTYLRNGHQRDPKKVSFPANFPLRNTWIP